MIGGSRPVVAAAVLALCTGCSSSNGRAICAPCPPPVTITVTGFDRLAGDDGRMRICVGDLPCSAFRIDRRATQDPVSCDEVMCWLDDTGALHVALRHRAARTVADLPVRVTASSSGDRRQGSGTMTYVSGKEPCRCDSANARLTLN